MPLPAAQAMADYIDGKTLRELSSGVKPWAQRMDDQLMGSTHEDRVERLLEEIRDTLQGRRGLIAMPSAAECERFGKAVR